MFITWIFDSFEINCEKYYNCEYTISNDLLDHDELELKALCGNVKSLFSRKKKEDERDKQK